MRATILDHRTARSSILFDRLRSPAIFVLVGALPPIVGAWLLLSPSTMLSQEMTWDLLFNLAGAWHLHWGHIAHVDFHEPVGELNFILTWLGFRVVGFTPKAFLVGEVIAASVVFAAASLIACRRLPVIAAAIFTAFATLLILMPVNVGDPLNSYSFAMAYNRYGWSALCILCLVVFQPARSHRGGAIDAGVFLALLMALFYIKITYFAAGLAALGVALLFSEHVRCRWRLWCLVGALPLLNAAAPYSRPYMMDILSAAEAGGVRSGVSFHLNRFLSYAAEYAPYFAATIVATWLWAAGRAPSRLPAAVGFLTFIGLLMLSQNAQTHGLPVATVIAILLYAQLVGTQPKSPACAPSPATAPLLVALLVFPALQIGASAFSLTGYWLKANRVEALVVMRGTQLEGLAVPAEPAGMLEAFSAGKPDYTLLNRARAVQPRFELSQAEYVETLVEASRVLQAIGTSSVVVLDQVNPLPFMLGIRPGRHGNLWSGLGAPRRDPEKLFDDATDVLIPKFSTYRLWTAKAGERYGEWLEEHYSDRQETRSWIVLRRSERGVDSPTAARAVAYPN